MPATSTVTPIGARGLLHELRAQRLALGPGAVVLALMLIWAEHDGGYDADTWYWGALVTLALLAVLLVLGRLRAPSGPARVALAALAAYTAWSYLSITWAQVPGWALAGSNRTLLYLLLFALLATLPWTAQSALVALVVFALGVGVLATLMLLRLASGSGLDRLVIDGRLAAPTGYFNSSVALFMIDALLCVGLAARRELPGALRGILLAFACASLQLCVMGQSRGWLFTLPLVLVVSVWLVRERLRVLAATLLPLIGALIPIRRLLHVFQGHSGEALTHAASRAAHPALLLCAAVLVLGSLAAWGEQLAQPRPLGGRGRRLLGTLAACAALAGGAAGILTISRGHPFSFISRQWHGFIHPGASSIASSSHFTSVGSGRYDFWRVSLDAVAAHPLGGLGQDNFADYYITRRHTGEEPRWTHSIEMRLLAHTGVVGLLLFAGFLVAALLAAARAVRDQEPSRRAVAAIALLPLVVWLVHGSVDWFWEMPALSGPALGFLAVAAALDRGRRGGSGARTHRLALRPPGPVKALALGILFAAATVALGFPYLAVRETSRANDIASRDPRAALADLRIAAELDPTSPEPPRLAGTIALQADLPQIAAQRFTKTITREPDGWYGWLGEGLAQSTLGNAGVARRDLQTAARLNNRDPVIATALARVDSTRPLTPAQALQELSLE